MTLKTFTTLGVLSLALGIAPRASAQSGAAADALFQEGQAALERGDLDVACPKLRESDRLDPANGTKLNLADCEEKRGRLASAWELYRKLSDTLAVGDERLPYVQQRAQALAPRVPRLTLKLAADAPADTQATLGPLVLSAASFGTALPVDPGPHDVLVAAAGSKRSFSITLAEGEIKTLEITPHAAAVAPAPAPAPLQPQAAPAADRKAAGHNTKTVGYVLGGVGVVGIGIGALTGIIGLNDQATGDANCSDLRRVCNQKGVTANDSARTMAKVSTAGFIVGVLGLGAGAYFVLTSSSNDKVALGARVSGAAASLDMSARW